MRRVDIATQAKIIRSIIRTVMGSVCVCERRVVQQVVGLRRIFIGRRRVRISEPKRHY